MKPTPETPNPIELNISLSDISATAINGVYTADTPVRDALAEHLELISLDNFQCSYVLKPVGKSRAKFEATLNAKLQQLSAISLEPVAKTIDDSFETEFRPMAQQGGDEADELDIEFEDKLVEYYIGETLDIGQVIYEHFVITIEQFPRAEGETFDWQNSSEDLSTDNNPFAALKALKNK